MIASQIPNLPLGYCIIAAIAVSLLVMCALTLWVWVDGDCEEEPEEGDDW